MISALSKRANEGRKKKKEEALGRLPVTLPEKVREAVTFCLALRGKSFNGV